MENDKSNSFCVFCDKDKKVLPKEKPKPKIEEKQKTLGPPNNNEDVKKIRKFNEKIKDYKK